jgi:DNA-directed RNA polymerase I and III subunit RPAC2
MKNSPNTEFCGYSVPHPSEDIMNIRLQSFEIHTDKVLNKGLLRISKMCDIMTDKFKNSLNEYYTHSQSK